MRKNVKKNLIDAACILAGNTILAFIVAAFIIPHNIIVGGTTGIGIVLSKALHIDTANIILVINIALLILGLIVLGKKFFLTTIASSLLYPIILKGFERIPNIDKMTDNSLLAAIFAGVLLGISLGLVMRVGSSTGGMDVVTLILHKWTHVSVAVYVNILDLIVIGGQALFSKPEDTMLGLVVLILETYVLEQVMILGKSQIQVFVVSEKYEQIREALLNDLEAGVTMTFIETGMLKQEQKGVLCVIPPRKLYDANELVCKIDPSAFMTVTKIKEVRGKGFTLERTPSYTCNDGDNNSQK